MTVSSSSSVSVPPCSMILRDQPDAPLIFKATAPIDYLVAVEFMENYVAKMLAGEAREAVWFLQHPEIYTAGSSAKPEDMLDPGAIPVIPTGRGGKHTYHGPGQIVIYAMIHLTNRNLGVKEYVCALEQIIIDTLKALGLAGERRGDRIGVWLCDRNADGKIVQEEKIAAVGVRVRRGVTFHGAALNWNVSLERFNRMIPCGIREFGVTSLEKRGVIIEEDELIHKIISNVEF